MTQEEILSWIRNDIEGIRESINRIYDKLEGHENACPARKAYFKKPSTQPSVSKASFWNQLIKLGPIILAAALGLLGLGAYLGSSYKTDNLQKEISAMKKALKVNQ